MNFFQPKLKKKEESCLMHETSWNVFCVHLQDYNYNIDTSTRYRWNEITWLLLRSSFVIHLSIQTARRSRINRETTQTASSTNEKAQLSAWQTSTSSWSTLVQGQQEDKNQLENNSVKLVNQVNSRARSTCDPVNLDFTLYSYYVC